MKHIFGIFISIVLIYLVTVQCGPLNVKSSATFRHTRHKRRSNEATTTTTQKPKITPNNLQIGRCDGDGDKVSGLQ
jgi:predicted nucleic acid binding AN1-type Zn finger protein